jgi:hypothetical protein
MQTTTNRNWLILLVLSGLLGVWGFGSDGFYDAIFEVIEPKQMRKPIDTSGSAAVQAAVEQREAEGESMTYSPLTASKMRGLSFTFAAMALFNALVSFMSHRFSNRLGRFDPFPLAIAVSLVILVVGYRWTLGVGWGSIDVHAGLQASTGYLFNDVDNISYASWAMQSQTGRWLFSDLFTTEPHGQIYFNPYFILVGRTASWTGLSVFQVLNGFGIVGASATIILLYWISITVGFSRSAARWACVFAAFSSGLTSIMTIAHAAFSLPLLLGTDAIYIESILSNSFVCWPYVSVVYAMLSTCVLLALRHEKLQRAWMRRMNLISLLLVGIALIMTHPYEGVLLLGVATLSCGHTWLRGLPHLREHLWVAITFAIVVIPVTAYNAYVTQQPVWNYFATVCLSDSRPWWSWLIGYGLILPLGVVSAVRALRNSGAGPAHWLAIWLLVFGGMLIIINIKQTTRLCNGLHIPMCILAAAAWAGWLKWVASQRTMVKRSVMAVCVIITMPLLFFTPYTMLLYGYRPQRYDSQLVAAAATLRSESLGEYPRVLTGVRTARMLAVLTPAHVYAGHYALTPDYAIKRDRLLRAGFVEPDDHLSESLEVDEDEFSRLVTESETDFVVLHSTAPAARLASQHTALKLLSETGRWQVYRIDVSQADVEATAK